MLRRSSCRAAAIQRLDDGFGSLFRVQESGDQDLPPGVELAHFQRGRCLIVLALAHPLGPLFRLGEQDKVVACPKLLAGTKVGAALARTILLEHTIDAAPDQLAQQEIRRVVGVSQQDVIALQGIEQRTQQRLLITAFAFARTARRVE